MGMILVRRIPTAVLALLMLGVLLAPSALATQPNNEVPLKGYFAGVATEFSGNFSHLGGFTGLVDLDPSDGTDDTVWTAANGDTVTNLTTSFVLGAGSFPVFEYEQTIVITGGTGRFQDSTGSAFITGTIDLSTGAYDGQLDGNISQPGPRH